MVQKAIIKTAAFIETQANAELSIGSRTKCLHDHMKTLVSHVQNALTHSLPTFSIIDQA